MERYTIRNYIAGEHWEPGSDRSLPVTNPATGETIARAPLSTPAEVDGAVQAAARAQAAWRGVPASRRVQPLFRLAALLRAEEERISRVLVEEMGKSLADARAELKRTIENVEAACGMPIHQQGQTLVQASFDIDGEVLRLPLGVFGVIAPFNFPAMVPFWFIPTAIATGNAVVVKASEQVPCTLQAITELLHQVDLPPGVFNLVHGDKEAARALVAHPQVAGISFVGSTGVGRQIAEACARHGKRFQVMGSAKNHLVVMPDADLDEAVRNMITSCYGCAGQRCMAASAVVAVGADTYREVCQRFVAASRQVPVGDPLDPRHADEPALMGPVISAAARERVEALIAQGVDEGATLALDGRGLELAERPGGFYVGPTVLTDVAPGMAVHQTEIFGPVVVILQADDLDAALRIINEHPYGNGASIYTRSGYWARRFKLEAEAGMIGINVGIPAPVAHLPFGGMKASLQSDIKAQGTAGIEFFTQAKIVTARYPAERP